MILIFYDNKFEIPRESLGNKSICEKLNEIYGYPKNGFKNGEELTDGTGITKDKIIPIPHLNREIKKGYIQTRNIDQFVIDLANEKYNVDNSLTEEQEIQYLANEGFKN